jgi:sulfonate transport system ATP-binding protein
MNLHHIPQAGAQPTPYGALAVDIKGLRRSFSGRVVLDSVDLAIQKGEFVAMLGRSGSGKSTILRSLAGLDSGAEGQALAAEKRAIVFQSPRLFPWKRVLSNVILGLSDEDAKTRGEEALAEVGLATHLRAWPGTLSGGEAQRVALARALVREPDLILLDEPFGALDALTRIKMQLLLGELCARHQPAVLLVTHDVDEAIQLADRIVVLSNGRISLDRRIDLPAPRGPETPGVGQLRRELLAELGVQT